MSIKIVFASLILIAIFLISGCVMPDQWDKFCSKYGYDGYDYDLFSTGWCYKAENDTIVEKRCLTSDNGKLYFIECD